MFKQKWFSPIKTKKKKRLYFFKKTALSYF